MAMGEQAEGMAQQQVTFDERIRKIVSDNDHEISQLRERLSSLEEDKAQLSL
jgi:hypothetical protein